MVNLLVENEAAAYFSSAPIASIEEVTGDISPQALQYYSEGVALSKQGKHELALEAYEMSLRHDRQNPQAWYNKGVALGRLELLEEALMSFEQALKLRPSDSQSWLSKGIISLIQHNFNEAVVAFEKAQIDHESNPQMWMFKGIALGCLAKFAEAQLAFQNSFSIKHTLPDESAYLYQSWATSTLAWGIDALTSNDVNAFEKAGNAYLDVWDKAESENAGTVVEDALAQFATKLRQMKQRKTLAAFEELVRYISLMKIKDPFEGWRALGEAISERWPKGLSAVKAVRETRR